MERYIIVERYADNGELSHRALVDSADGRELGTDGGEPEDQSFWRDWAWVPDELNRQQATIAALQADNRTYINERHDNMKQIEQLQADLAERTAELEAAKASQAIDLKNNNAYREQVATLQAELERVRGLVKTYAAAKIDFDDKRLQEDHHAWRERYNKLVEAENALLQHRQGVEG